MKKKVDISIGEFYHIYNRGVEKRDVFIDNTDYRRFVLLLHLFNEEKPVNVRDFKESPRGGASGIRGETIVDIGAYCLMSNHFHLLLKEKKEGGIRNFIHKLTTGYTMYFNKRYERVGPLFQGTFKTKHANSDEYLKYLFSYIHLNPLKIIDNNWKENGFKNTISSKLFLDNYEYSSYLDYHNPKKFHSDILNKESFPEYFISTKDFDQNIADWIEYKINL